MMEGRPSRLLAVAGRTLFLYGICLAGRRRDRLQGLWRGQVEQLLDECGCGAAWLSAGLEDAGPAPACRSACNSPHEYQTRSVPPGTGGFRSDTAAPSWPLPLPRRSAGNNPAVRLPEFRRSQLQAGGDNGSHSSLRPSSLAWQDELWASAARAALPGACWRAAALPGRAAIAAPGALTLLPGAANAS